MANCDQEEQDGHREALTCEYYGSSNRAAFDRAAKDAEEAYVIEGKLCYLYITPGEGLRLLKRLDCGYISCLHDSPFLRIHFVDGEIKTDVDVPSEWDGENVESLKIHWDKAKVQGFSRSAKARRHFAEQGITVTIDRFFASIFQKSIKEDSK